MSRRRGEFEHRTSIFEGAFRAWSHLGGLEPEDLESKAAADLDPLTHPLEQDTRLNGGNQQAKMMNPDGSTRREYPYEPLPRSGLAHPYVQAILSPWLGPDADNEAIQLGLTTLRTWWQHRRKGESGSAVAALGTEKMKGVVEGYTRHFFTLAHCLVMNDKEQPPRTLHSKMKELEKLRSKRKKRTRDDPGGVVLPGAGAANGGAVVGPGAGAGVGNGGTGPLGALGANGALGPGINGLAGGAESLAPGVNDVLTDEGMSPLERLHHAQRRQLADSGGLHTSIPGIDGNEMITPIINIKGKCIPGKIDLPKVVEAVNHHATQLAHRGGAGSVPSSVTSGAGGAGGAGQGVGPGGVANAPPQYGDPNTTPVVFVSARGDIQIAMTVDGITCAHCVKIVETVLKGCNGNKSPIAGLLDAAADRVLNSILIKIDRASNAKRIAFEAARNLQMVGYNAASKEMSIIGKGADTKSTMDLGALSTAFEVVASAESKDVFDWSIPCTCPDNGVLREDCARHSQMNTSIFQAFDSRMQAVEEYMAGCGMKYGMECTCGPGCRCKNCPIHPNNGNSTTSAPSNSNGNAVGGVGTNQGQEHSQQDQDQTMSTEPAPLQPEMFDTAGGHDIQVDESMDFFGVDPQDPMSAPGQQQQQAGASTTALEQQQQQAAQVPQANPQHHQQHHHHPHHVPHHHHEPSGRTHHNPSILSYGNGLRGMSITSETTFGRAMSGLSALSIDWENLEDFDLEVDHSAHINAAGGNSGGGNNGASPNRFPPMNGGGNVGGVDSQDGGGVGGGSGGGGGVSAMRSSLRRSHLSNGDSDGGGHVTFRV